MPRLLYVDGFRFFFFSREGPSRHTYMLTKRTVSPSFGFLLWNWFILEVSHERKYDESVS